MDALDHWADSCSDEPEWCCEYYYCDEAFNDEESLRSHEVEDHFCLDELPPVDDVQYETHALAYAASEIKPDYDNSDYFMLIESYHPSTPVRDKTKMFPKKSSTALEKSWHGLVQIVIWNRA
ncbi:hypothetical protein E8E14_010913 [Neopestalotiopsis sp. 37M]|nr:hypothetical protein E8E14_010913 [Neopestalotiopsis sp. 37M]